MQPLFAYQPEGLTAIAIIGLIVAVTMPLYESFGVGKWIAAILALSTSIAILATAQIWIAFKDRQFRREITGGKPPSHCELSPKEKTDNQNDGDVDQYSNRRNP